MLELSLTHELKLPVCFVICRTVFILSEALDEQLKALWFSPFQTDDIETDLDMVSKCVCVYLHFQISQGNALGLHNHGIKYYPDYFYMNIFPLLLILFNYLL